MKELPFEMRLQCAFENFEADIKTNLWLCIKAKIFSVPLANNGGICLS